MMVGSSLASRYAGAVPFSAALLRPFYSVFRARIANKCRTFRFAGRNNNSRQPTGPPCEKAPTAFTKLVRRFTRKTGASSPSLVTKVLPARLCKSSVFAGGGLLLGADTLGLLEAPAVSPCQEERVPVDLMPPVPFISHVAKVRFLDEEKSAAEEKDDPIYKWRASERAASDWSGVFGYTQPKAKTVPLSLLGLEDYKPNVKSLLVHCLSNGEKTRNLSKNCHITNGKRLDFPKQSVTEAIEDNAGIAADNAEEQLQVLFEQILQNHEIRPVMAQSPKLLDDLVAAAYKVLHIVPQRDWGKSESKSHESILDARDVAAPPATVAAQIAELDSKVPHEFRAEASFPVVGTPYTHKKLIALLKNEARQ